MLNIVSAQEPAANKSYTHSHDYSSAVFPTATFVVARACRPYFCQIIYTHWNEERSKILILIIINDDMLSILAFSIYLIVQIWYWRVN